MNITFLDIEFYVLTLVFWLQKYRRHGVNHTGYKELFDSNDNYTIGGGQGRSSACKIKHSIKACEAHLSKDWLYFKCNHSRTTDQYQKK